MPIELVSLVVTNYDTAIDFFVNSLGFELVEDTPSVTADGRTTKRWVVVRPPDGGAGLLLAESDGDRQESAVGNQTGGRVAFFLNVDDFERHYELMRAHGVRFLEEPRSEPYGQVVVFEDIAGNRWDLLGPAPG